MFTESRRLRGRPHRGADGGAAPPDVHRPGPGAIEAELVTPEQVVERVPFLEMDEILGAFWTPVGRRGRLAARRHADARVRAWRSARSPSLSTVEVTGMDVEEGRIRRVRTDRRRHRVRDRRHRLRRVEPEARGDGGRVDPADARGAPDDQRRADPAARRAAGRDLVPDRPRHGHVLLRAPARRRHGGRLLRPPRRSCTTPRRSRRSSRPSCPRPRCRSPPTTSTRSSSRRSS